MLDPTRHFQRINGLIFVLSGGGGDLFVNDPRDIMQQSIVHGLDSQLLEAEAINCYV